MLGRTVTWRTEALSPVDAQKLGGWRLDLLRSYDAATGRIFSAGGASNVMDVPVGGGLLEVIAGMTGFRADGDGGQATGATVWPLCLAVSPAGRLSIVEAGPRIRVVGDDGVIRTILKARTNTGGQYCATMAPDGTVYISDDYDRVYTMDSFGNTTLFAGGGTPTDGIGDGGPATAAKLGDVDSMAVGPDGSVYLLDWIQCRVRRVDPSGAISTVAGGGTPVSGNGDGGPATAAKLSVVEAVSVAPDGSILIAGDWGTVRKVGTDGIIRTVAGGGTSSSDGVPATEASLQHVWNVVAADGGGFYITSSSYQDHQLVRKVDVEGRIWTVAGGGSSDADGVPATTARINNSNALACGPDGSVYVSTKIVDSNYYYRVRRIGSDGTITTVAGGGQPSEWGDGLPGPYADVYPFSLAIADDGTIYFADGSSTVRAMGADGIVRRVAGGGEPPEEPTDPIGDGGPALEASMYPTDVQIGPDNSIYILDETDWSSSSRVRKVDANGVITTIAGGGSSLEDGIPATQADLGSAAAIAVGPEGSLYIAESHFDDLTCEDSGRIRRVDPNGMISTVAGGGSDYDWLYSYSPPAPAIATSVALEYITSLAVADDGSVYAGWWQGVIKVTPDGLVSMYAGGDWAYGGDGGPALGALVSPDALAVSPDGTLFIGEDSGNYSTGGVVRQVSPSGTITTIAGGGKFKTPVSSARSTYLQGLEGLAVGPDGTLHIADGSFIRRFCASGRFRVDESLIPSRDGSEVYLFDRAGRHLQTLDGLSGAPIYTFDYRSDGLLSSYADRSGGVTTIERDSAGIATAIVGPEGQRTELSTNALGQLVGVTCPLGNTETYEYDDTGNVVKWTDRAGRVTTYSYARDGKLVTTTYPGGGSLTLSRQVQNGALTLTATTAEGRTKTMRTARLADGTVQDDRHVGEWRHHGQRQGAGW